MIEEVTIQQKVELLLSVAGLSGAAVARAVDCTEAQLLAGDLTAEQQQHFVALSEVFNSSSAASATYFGIEGENEAYIELRLLQVLVAAGPECVMLRGSASATQRKALLVSLEAISNPTASRD